MKKARGKKVSQQFLLIEEQMSEVHEFEEHEKQMKQKKTMEYWHGDEHNQKASAVKRLDYEKSISFRRHQGIDLERML